MGYGSTFSSQRLHVNNRRFRSFLLFNGYRGLIGPIYKLALEDPTLVWLFILA